MRKYKRDRVELVGPKRDEKHFNNYVEQNNCIVPDWKPLNNECAADYFIDVIYWIRIILQIAAPKK